MLPEAVGDILQAPLASEPSISKVRAAAARARALVRWPGAAVNGERAAGREGRAAGRGALPSPLQASRPRVCGRGPAAAVVVEVEAATGRLRSIVGEFGAWGRERGGGG